MTSSVYCILTSGYIHEMPYGEERFALALGRWLLKQNQNVVLIGRTFTGVKAEYLSKVETNQNKKNNGKNIRVAYPPHVIYMMSRLLFSLFCFLQILLINKKSPIKLIHAQDTGYSGLAAVMAGKMMKIPVILSSHGIRHKSLESILKGRLGRILLKFEYNLDIFTLKRADSIIAVNPEIRDYLRKITAKVAEFIPNPIKLENFVFSQTNRDLIRKELGIEKHTIVVGFVGRLSAEKNLLTLLNSFVQAIGHYSSMKLVIVGTGTLDPQLREEVGRLGAKDKVIFCGMRHDISRVLSGFDIFVLPSYTEGLSSALLEAMSCERAVICSDIPANRLLIIHKREGLLISPHSCQELSEAIQLLANDESLRSELGTNAKIKASEYDEEAVFSKILQHYLTLTKKVDS